MIHYFFFFFSSRRRHTIFDCDWSSDVCSSDLGPQTPGELKQRTERLHRFESLVEIEQTLDALIGRDLAARLPRRPGQKEQRYAQLLGGDSADRPDLPTVREDAAPTGLEARV